MMRGPSNWAVAVRRPDGRISEVAHPVTSWAAKRRWLRLPVIRGMVALGESLAIGFKAIAVSADYAASRRARRTRRKGSAPGYRWLVRRGHRVLDRHSSRSRRCVLTELFPGYDSRQPGSSCSSRAACASSCSSPTWR